MKNDLTCGLVRDLLPSYVEDLVCSESREAVDRHLADCPSCTAALNAMRAPEPEAATEEQSREVDYLKQVKKQNNRKIIVAVACTIVALLAALLLKVFVIGSPLQPQTVSAEGTVDGGILHLSLMSTVSANAFHSWRVETVDGVASVYARDVLVSPLFSDGSGKVDVPLEKVHEVWLGGTSGRLLWQDGVVISQLALELMDAKAPHCGDLTALQRIAEILRLPERLGSYTFSLQTDKHPYGGTLVFVERPTGEQLNLVTCYNLLTLALVDNMEASLFKRLAYGDPPDLSTIVTNGMWLDSVNETVLPALVEEYNVTNGTDWEPKASIKDYTRSPADLQQLLMILDSFYHTGLFTRGD